MVFFLFRSTNIETRMMSKPRVIMIDGLIGTLARLGITVGNGISAAMPSPSRINPAVIAKLLLPLR